MGYFTLQAGTGAVVAASDLQDDWYGIVNASGAAGFFCYSQDRVTIGSVTSSQSVSSNNGADYTYVANQLAALMANVVGPYSDFSAVSWFNDQKNRPSGSYLDMAYYAGMQIWSGDNALAFLGAGKWFTQSTPRSAAFLPNEQSYAIAGTLPLNIAPM